MSSNNNNRNQGNRRVRGQNRGHSSNSNSNGKSKSRSLTQWKRNETNDSTNPQENGDEDDSNVCIVCAESMKIVSISDCNHKVCHMCSFRQRALYEKKQCLVCRTENETLIFTENTGIQNYTDLDPVSIVTTTDKYQIGFTSFEAKDITLGLLEYRCPLNNCDEHEKFPNFKKLNEHTRESHNKVYCSLCANFKKAFISELRLYTTKQLQAHQSKGDEDGFTGHPLCKFCSGKRFYSDDELFVHMREKHEKCHVCDQIDSSNPQYFKNYNHLFEHFQEIHFICNVQSCLDQKFIVFGDEIDLQAHMIKEHANMFGGGRTLLSSSSGFGSQLSTFSSTRNTNKPRDDNENHDSYEIKKMRLEERARHYLHYSQSGFNHFQDINTAYSNDKISAEELFVAYEDVFSKNKTSDVDYNVLTYELAQLFPSNSPKCQNLLKLSEQQNNEKKLEEQFPALLPTKESNIVTGPWGSAGKSSKNLTSSGHHMPALPTASAPVFRSSTSNVPRTRGISSSSTPANALSIPGYITIKRPAKKPAHTFSMAASNGTSSPTILSTPAKKTNSGVKLSYLSTTSSSSSLASTSSQKKSAPRVDDSLFPSLPDVPKKKVIPRVKPVINSIGQWSGTNDQGSSSQGENNNNNDDLFDMMALNRAIEESKGGKKKKKGKQKQLLFHIGIGN